MEQQHIRCLAHQYKQCFQFIAFNLVFFRAALKTVLYLHKKLVINIFFTDHDRKENICDINKQKKNLATLVIYYCASARNWDHVWEMLWNTFVISTYTVSWLFYSVLFWSRLLEVYTLGSKVKFGTGSDILSCYWVFIHWTVTFLLCVN